MPKVIELRKRKGERKKYPWKQWMTAKGTILRRGQDYQCSTESFVVYGYNRLIKLNKKAGNKPQYLMLLKLDDNHVYIKLKKSPERDTEEENRVRQQFLAAKALLTSKAKKKKVG